MPPYTRLAVARSPRNATRAGIGPPIGCRGSLWLLPPWMARFGCGGGLDDGLPNSDATTGLVGTPLGVS